MEAVRLLLLLVESVEAWAVTLARKGLVEDLISLDGVNQLKFTTLMVLIHKDRVTAWAVVVPWAAILWEEEWVCSPTTWEA
jgi:hypothetical protein